MRILIAGLSDKTQNYVAAVAATGMESVVSLTLPTDLTFPDFDGLILPGGADIDPARYGQPLCGSQNIAPELDDAQFAILDAFLKTEKPVLGICKGHQILNVYFGGDLIQDLENSSSHRANPDDQVHLTHAEPDSWLARLYGTDFATNSSHHQAVGQVGRGFHVIQRSDDGVIEAIAHESRPILSVQWHPERMCCGRRRTDTADGSQVFLYFRKLCEEYQTPFSLHR